MSTSYHAYVLFGFPVHEDTLFNVKKERGCGHALTQHRHCGECGKAMWVENRTSKDVYELTSSDCRGAPNGSWPGLLRAEIGEWPGFIGILFAATSPGETCALASSPTPIEQEQYARKIKEWCAKHDIEFDEALTKMRLIHTWS